MNKSSLYISLVALVVAVSCFVMCATNCKKATVQPKAAVNAADVASVLNNDPQIIINALQKFEELQREAQAKEAAKLFKENIEELQNDPSTPFVGPKDAKVVLVEFFDFSCGYCKRLAPTVEALVKANPDVKFVFKPITFVAPISKYAAKAALAANEQGKFIEMYTALLGSNERLDEEKINAIAEKLGLDMAKFNADVSAQKAQDAINNVAQLGNKLQIHGVPALVLNGTPLQTNGVEGIQEEINKLK